jgi:hypothetical protein
MRYDEAEKLLADAVEFQATILESRDKCRKQYIRVEKEEENTLRFLIDAQIGCLAKALRNKIDKVTAETSYQVGVSCSFIRTHFLATDLFMTGDLIESMVLIRKQLESLTRLVELDSKPLQKLLGKVPNITNVLKKPSGRMYEDLSEVAHFSRPRVTELLHSIEKGELVGPSLLPVFNDKCFACFDMNCFIALFFIAWLVERLPGWYPNYDNTAEKEMLARSFDLALKCGVIKKEEKA